jgi:RsiW-degrading membrane proteinase PrsW (M82 family)
VAQIGIHLVFFLHITTDPDNANNILALAFGVLIVCLIVFGSLWVMLHLTHSLMPMDQLMRMQHWGVVARIFFLDLGAGRVLSANPDGSDLQTLVREGRKLPDGLAVDAAAGRAGLDNLPSR